MKNAFLGFLLFTSAVSFAGEINVKVNGLVCSMCAQGIKKKFSKTPDVKGITVNLDEKLVRIEVKDGATVTDAEITKNIQEAGYNVVKIQR